MRREAWVQNGVVRLELVEWRPETDAASFGVALVCVHGALGSAWGWESEAKPAAAGTFGGRPRNVTAFSRRGMGLSDAPATGYGLDDFVGDLSAVVRAIAYPRYALVAHSLGVPIALKFASQKPRGLVGLVLGDYGPRYPVLGASWVEQIEARFRTFANWEDAYQRATPKSGDEVRDRARFDEIKRRYIETPSGQVESFFNMDAVRRMSAESRETDLSGLLGSLLCPVLLVTGDAPDVALAPVDRAQYETDLADVRVVTLAGAGHGLLVEGSLAPFHAALGDFLGKLDEAG